MSKIYESDFEEAIVEKLKQEGWMHSREEMILIADWMKPCLPKI